MSKANAVQNVRVQWVYGILWGVLCVLMLRVFMLQVWHTGYRVAAERNSVKCTLLAPARGLIYDRKGRLLVGSRPVFHLGVIPQKVDSQHVGEVAGALGLEVACLQARLEEAKRYSCRKMSIVHRYITCQEAGRIQDRLAYWPGFCLVSDVVRDYTLSSLANTLGHMGEVSPETLAQDAEHYYRLGDMLGVSGLEKHYEKVLRGKRGVVHELVDAHGRTKGPFSGGKLDITPQAGQDLHLGIDAELQQYAEYLLAGSSGSVVALEPATGEVLAMVTSPSYDPAQMRIGRDMGTFFARLEQDPLCPLFHRPIMAMHPPGSILKVFQGLVALDMGVVTPQQQYACRWPRVKCHAHPAPLSLHGAIQYSCNPYFCRIFQDMLHQAPVRDVRAGFSRWREYMLDFGLGAPLGIDLPGEKRGYVPTIGLYDGRYTPKGWGVSTIRSLDIGQGEMLITPLQMANLAAILANRGYYYTPHIVRFLGEGKPAELAYTRRYTRIDAAHFACVVNAMRDVVDKGTGWRLRIKGIEVCAKTGTAENPHGEDHSVCIAFAPYHAPRIALAVYVEHAKWGGRAAAAVAGLLIERYLTGRIRRTWVENYVRQKAFLAP